MERRRTEGYRRALLTGYWVNSAYYKKSSEHHEGDNGDKQPDCTYLFMSYDETTFLVPRGYGVFRQSVVRIDKREDVHNWNPCCKPAPPDFKAPLEGHGIRNRWITCEAKARSQQRLTRSCTKPIQKQRLHKDP